MALNVGAVPGKPWRLQVLVNDASVLTRIITSDSGKEGTQYQDLRVDLSEYAGRNVRVRLYHWLVDGKPPGSAYWKTVVVRAV